MIEVPDEELPDGWLPMHGMVPRLSGTPGILARPAPRLGEHNAAILARSWARRNLPGCAPRG